MSLFQKLKEISAQAPAENGIFWQDQFISYADVVPVILQWAAFYQDQGVEKGDAVALVLPNGPQAFISIYALFALGAVAMPLSPAAAPAEIHSAMKRAKARAIIANGASQNLATSAVEGLTDTLPSPIFMWPEGEAETPSGESEMASLQLPEVAPEQAALYLLSSGTTGQSKIVVHTHGTIYADAVRTHKAWDIQENDKIFDMLPPNFAMGLLLGLTVSSLKGASVYYWLDTRPLILARKAILQTLSDHKITAMGAVPAMYEAMCTLKNAPDLSNMRLAFSGGAALKHETYLACQENLGLTLRQAYGLSEALLISANSQEDAKRLWQSVGKPIGDAQIKIDRFDEGLPEGAGEILVQSSAVMPHYLDQPDETANCLQDGWLRTGDLAKLDEEGRLEFVGRRKLLIETMGYKIDPIEIENLLMDRDDVVEAIIAGTGGKDQKLKAYIRAEGEQPDAESLRQYLRQNLSAQKVPAVFEFVEEFPKSSAGKILRSKL